jgi:cobalt-zinc-cadmium efflux system membrane fusion protein
MTYRTMDVLSTVRCAALAALLFSVALPAGSAPLGCLITPARIADVGTPAAGVIERIAVDRGDAVRKGQVLVTLRADSERASLAAAQVRAGAEAAVAGAQASALLAQQKLERAEDLYRQQFISAQALEQARAERAVAAQTLQQALDQRAVYHTEVQQARAQLGLRTLTSPISGIVVDRMAHPGERVELQAVLRVADVSQLRVEVVVPASRFGSIRKGASAGVQPEVPGLAVRPAVVTQVDRVIDAASNTFRVRLALPNEDGGVPAGARCRIDFDGPGADASPTAALVQPARVR